MLFLGTSGWSYRHWKGRFYPEILPQSGWLGYYARYFNTVEVNSSFYHFPRQSAIRNWYEHTPEGFVFSLKANRSITHLRKFENSGQAIRNFYDIGDGLKEKMGCFLFQLPEAIGFSGKKLNQIISQLDLERKNAIEFRNPSWFNEEVYDKLRENNIILCWISSPDLPESLVKTSEDIYIRLHGKTVWYAGNYSKEELDAWAENIRIAKAKNSWAYFNNDANAYAVKNCLYLKKALKQKQKSA